MKKMIFLFPLSLLLVGMAWGQIVAWEFDGKAGNEVTVNATTNDANLATSVISRGAGLNASALGNAYSSTNYTANGTKADAVTNNKYMQFQISANAGHKVSLSTLDVNFRRSGTGPNAFAWQYSLDGFATTGVAIGNDISYTDSPKNGTVQTQISLTDIAGLQNVTSGTTITFRIYGWGASATGGTFAIGRLSGNDLAVGGTVETDGGTPTTSITVTPTSLTDFTYVHNSGPSDEQSFTISGSNLTNSISISAPANYEISLTSGSGYTSSITLTQTNGLVNETPIYVILPEGLATGNYEGDIALTSDGAVGKFVSFSGAVTEPAAPADNLFFSEYIEGGTGNNKAIEIFNASNGTVNLERYQIELYSNGAPAPTQTQALSGTLAAGDVYVIANSQSDQTILDKADITSAVCFFNGDDALVLRCVNPDTIIDVFGVVGTDPGTAWDVAGTTGATADHTLIRKPTVVQGNIDWVAQAGTNASDSEWIVHPDMYFDDLGSHTYNPDALITAAPIMDPAGGFYFTSINVAISSDTPGADIYYTTDGTDPSITAGTIYTIPIAVSETTTIKAIAYADGYDPSAVVGAVYSMPVNVSDIATLRDMPTGSSNVYTLTGEAVLTYQNANRNTKYIQDATAAIVIDDYSGLITTAYNLYDGITGITGSLNVYSGLVQFVPVADPGAATSSNNIIEPEVRTLTSLTSADQAKLIKVMGVTITDATLTDFPATAENLVATDATAELTLRTFVNTDYANTPIPTEPVNLTCLVGQFNAAMQVGPRFLSDFETLLYDYPDGVETDAGVVLIEITDGNGIIVPGELTPVPNPNFIATFEQKIELTGDGPWTVTVFSVDAWVACLFNGEWLVAEVPQVEPNSGYVNFWLEIPEVKNTVIELKAGNGGNPTPPIELSSFTVALNSYNNAILTWVTQTETSVSGFYIYRSNGDLLENAIQISNLISATNTSQQHVYIYRDKELQDAGTYYYWLQVADMDGSESFHGPITLVYEGGSGPQIPSIPMVTELKSVFPNPFNPSATISYALKNDASVSVNIYNSRGQLVRSFTEGLKAAGNHNLAWNGDDDSGRSLASGVYHIRMQAGSQTFTKKAVLMK